MNTDQGQKKKLKVWQIVVIVIVSLIIISFAFSGNSDKEGQESTVITTGVSAEAVAAGVETPTVEESPETPADQTAPLVFDCDDGTLAYTKHELAKDYEGKPALIVYFDYTNKDESAAHNAMFAFRIQGFQNGIAGDSVILMDRRPEESDAAMTDVKAGVTIPVAFSFGLQDETSDVELEVSELMSFSNEKATQILKLV